MFRLYRAWSLENITAPWGNSGIDCVMGVRRSWVSILRWPTPPPTLHPLPTETASLSSPSFLIVSWLSTLSICEHVRVQCFMGAELINHNVHLSQLSSKINRGTYFLWSFHRRGPMHACTWTCPTPAGCKSAARVFQGTELPLCRSSGLGRKRVGGLLLHCASLALWCPGSLVSPQRCWYTLTMGGSVCVYA